jgi:hypothetical protein
LQKQTRGILFACGLALFIGAVVTAGCGRSGAKPALPAPAAGRPDLPAVTTLAGLHRFSYAEGDLLRSGASFEPALPHSGVNASGGLAEFVPGGATADTLAYAGYSFALEDYDRDASVRLTWAAQPAEGHAWLALANFSHQHWNWFPLPADGTVTLPSLAEYTGSAPDYALFAVVLVDGGPAAALQQIRIGGQPATGAPSALLEADRPLGLSPLTVTFDAGGSLADAPATLAKYEFDFGDGGGYLDNGPNPVIQHTYVSADTIQPLARVRVTDIFGATAEAAAQVHVGALTAFDEVEQVSFLPGLPFKGFRGNVGQGGSHDGDDYDELVLQGPAGAEATVRIDFSGAGVLSCDNHSSAQSPLEFKVTLAQGQKHLYLEADSGSHDYLVSASVPSIAAQLSATPAKGHAPLSTVLDASASTAAAPDHIVSYQFDPTGSGTYLPAQSDPHFAYAYLTAGTYAARVKVRDEYGNAGVATLPVYAVNGYDEMEDNDSLQTANGLPAVPFTSFSGNIGAGGAFDGDSTDWFRCQAASGQRLRFLLSSSISLKPDFRLFDATGDQLPTYAEFTPGMTFTVAPDTALPLYLKVAGGTPCDYSLACDLNPPTALLVANPDFSPHGQYVVLDASGSSDAAPGAIVSYQFDPEDDGFFLPEQAEPTLPRKFTEPGAHLVAVKVKDNEGHASIAKAWVQIDKHYDEQSSVFIGGNPGNTLPVPVAGWLGSIGNGPDYLAYNGSSIDYLQFAALPGQTFKVTLGFTPGVGDLGADISGGGAYQTSDSSAAGSLSFTHTVAADEGMFYLSIIGLGYYGDYTVDIELL